MSDSRLRHTALHDNQWPYSILHISLANAVAVVAWSDALEALVVVLVAFPVAYPPLAAVVVCLLVSLVASANALVKVLPDDYNFHSSSLTML